ncbi:MAG: putative rubrerythrin family protein [Streblomastix strix]|uniref:Putative rubrerythrin family protein n=1 Tax=Streblomastix strix TaxID=222440 RepID=A0A5J4W4J6_9EUKA|nr:MAG: putative rubrerythrin family protein [Streblomastix strix]
MSGTEKNIREGFSGESQARNRYTFFAEFAEKQGKPRTAALFRATAQGEEIHARRLFNFLLQGKTLEDCLKEAIDGETYEYTKMYPTFQAKAKEEGKKAEESLFGFLGPVEEQHAKSYTQALAALKKGEDLGDTGYKVFLCPVCGFIEIGKDPYACPVCKAPAQKFIEIK